MGAKDSIKKPKRKLAKRARKEDTGMEVSHAAQIAGTKEKKKKDKKKKFSGEVEVEAEVVETGHSNDKTHETSGVKKKKSRKLRDKRGNKSRIARIDDKGFNADESNEKKNTSEQCNDSKPREQFSDSEGINTGGTERNSEKDKLKKSEKIKKKRRLVANQSSSDNLLEKTEENADEVYQMSSGDEDYSKGMKKWVTQYHQSRPGLEVLQERIDDFIMAHDAKEEQAKAEKLAQAAEDGWTVVVHHKGRKKTTDADSGIAVGAVAQAAVLDKMAKKKKKEVGLSFYQFHKREAHRNEIMMLQSKFEQDKKRIQQMRAARKFRPY